MWSIQLIAWAKKDDACPLQRHANVFHNGGHFEVRLKILARCFGKPSHRLISESVLIDDIDDGMAMNNKNEWSFVKLAKIEVQGQQ